MDINNPVDSILENSCSLVSWLSKFCHHRIQSLNRKTMKPYTSQNKRRMKNSRNSQR